MNKYNHWLGKLFGLLNKNSHYAVTFGQTAYFSVPESEVSESWKVHEDEHKKQYAKDGTFVFLYRYIWQLITKGYYNIDYEIEARLAARTYQANIDSGATNANI